MFVNIIVSGASYSKLNSLLKKKKEENYQNMLKSFLTTASDQCVSTKVNVNFLICVKIILIDMVCTCM
jgi:hypothetical protein